MTLHLHAFSELQKLSRQLRIWSATLVCLCGVPMAAVAEVSTEDILRFDSFHPIPDSTVVFEPGQGIVRAALSCATDRYAHGILGDTLEAGCLVVEDHRGVVALVQLPQQQVFEDLSPRLADIDGDSKNDVVVVRSDRSLGASLVVYSQKKEAELQELVATPPIGTPNRWLAPIGIADFNSDGRLDIAYVQTPHIGGILKVWSFVDGRFKQLIESSGFSNHRIGSTRVSTARLDDINNDGVVDIALPDKHWQQTVGVTLHPRFRVLGRSPYQSEDFD